MTMTITETTANRIEVVKPGTGTGIQLDPDEQRELLEAFARIHGFSLVDREERKGLLALCEEVDEDDNDYATGSAAWTAWQDRCEALAEAVTSALRTGEE